MYIDQAADKCWPALRMLVFFALNAFRSSLKICKSMASKLATSLLGAGFLWLIFMALVVFGVYGRCRALD